MKGIFNRFSCAALALVVAVAGGLAYFKFFLPPSKATAAVPQQPAQPARLTLPDGAILIPYGNGLCWIRAIDSATAAIKDYGRTACEYASDQNSAAWRRAMNREVGVEVSKSFRHESDR
jgi:hypothetical protein